MVKDITNKQINNLFVIKKIPRLHRKTMQLWECKCDCGRNVVTTSYALSKNRTFCCGVCNDNHNKTRINTYEFHDDYVVGYCSTGQSFYFDLCDYELVKQYIWVYDKHGYIRTNLGDSHTISLHKLLTNNEMTDHIDRNGLNNRRNNLRATTDKQNSTNKNIMPTNKSGVIGVCWDKLRGRWKVTVSRNNKTINIGRYDNFEDAVISRLKAELKYYGEDYAPQRHMFEKYGITEKRW